ncbi:MAG: GxxExxY protein [Acidobacteria bacterium]|nr:GxxExxY protein [Acidobacteriota bacterium]
MAELIYPEECYRIVGAAFEVYNRMGCGFLEAVYQECLEIEFKFQGIPHEVQPAFHPDYRGTQLRREFRPDFTCYGKILVEIKSVSELVDAHVSQALNALHAAKYRLGILLNFGHHPQLEYQRIVLTAPRGQAVVREPLERYTPEFPADWPANDVKDWPANNANPRESGQNAETEE